MLKRKAMVDLENWHSLKGSHQALLVTGARQVGKTYLIRAFANEHYDHLAEVNPVSYTHLTLPTNSRV